MSVPLTQVLTVPEYWIVDAIDPQLARADRERLLADLIPIHAQYFPSYPHVIDELVEQARSGEYPAGERVHGWLVYRDGKPVGEWIMNVNLDRGIVMMLFGAIHREARIDLDREYLLRLVDFMLQKVDDIARAAGEELVGIILEADGPHIPRWIEAGFFIADSDYREPIGGRGWGVDGDARFFEAYSACVRPWGAGLDVPCSDVAERALSALLIDHYGLPADHPQVVRSLSAARESDPSQTV